MDRLQRSPQTRLLARAAAPSTSLYGQTLALALTTLDSPILQKSPTTTPSARKALAPMAAFRQTMASLMVAPGPTWASPPARKQVDVGLPVLAEVAPVPPVPLRHMAVERAPRGQERGEELLAEVIRASGGDGGGGGRVGG